MTGGFWTVTMFSKLSGAEAHRRAGHVVVDLEDGSGTACETCGIAWRSA